MQPAGPVHPPSSPPQAPTPPAVAGVLSTDNAAARLAGLLDSAMDGIIAADAQQNVVLYNRAAEQMFGWPAAEVLGRPLERLMPMRFRAGHSAHMRAFASTGVTTRRMGDGTVLYGLRASGEEFPVEASISQLDTPEGKLFTAILRDVSERVRAQQELSAFAAESHALREGEKTRVARELHDELAQSLTALKMDTIWLRDNAAAQPQQAAAKLDEMVRMLDTAVASTRRIAADLRPLLLDDLGLVAAIEWLVNNFAQRVHIPCALTADDDVDLPEPYATAVFRIVQESLANIAKHAQATEAAVVLVREPHALLLEVRDNGRGFDPASPRKVNSLGLMGLRERVQLIRGQVQVDSAPGQGTRIRVHIPLNGLEAGA